jgi:PST family polysaccharide transporter
VALVPRQLLVKAMNFQAIASADLIGMVTAGFLAGWMAYDGYGYWALVWQPITSRVLATLYIYWACNWRPSLQFSGRAVQELFGFSFYVFATRLVQYSVRQLDKLLVGRYLGAAQVGLLDKAQSMMLFPLKNVSNVIGSVMFPALSEIQHDVPRVRKVYLKSIQSIALLTFPMMAGMFAVAENFTVALLGEHWIELVPILRILCFAGLAYSIVTVTGTIYLSQGKAKLQFKVNLFTRPLAVIGILVGLQWGVQGVAIGATIAAWINTMITLKVAGRLIDLSLSAMFSGLYQVLLASLFMCIALFALDQYLAHLPPALVLVSKMILGMVIYFIIIFIMKVPAIGDLRAILENKFWRKNNR